MNKLAMALLLVFCANSVYAFGLFPRHRHHGEASGVPEHSSSLPDLGTSVPPIPEPETYLFMLVGAGIVAWIIHNKRK